jgi:ketosteroid isomerase-like protein
MDPAAVVRGLFERFEARDWAGARALVADDAVVRWPHTGEVFASGDAFIAVNEGYPEGWTIRVLRVVADGDQVASEIEVPHTEQGTSWAASFWTVRDGRIVAGTEYWVDEPTGPPPTRS